MNQKINNNDSVLSHLKALDVQSTPTFLTEIPSTQSPLATQNSKRTIDVSGETALIYNPILNAGFGIIPMKIFSELSSLVSNFSDFNKFTLNQRKGDRKEGISLIQGSKNFAQEVVDAYKLLEENGSNILNKNNILPNSSTSKNGLTDQSLGFENTEIIEKIGSQVLSMAGVASSLSQIFSNKLNYQEKALSGIAAGAYVGSSIVPGFGTALGALSGGIAGLLTGMFKSGKPAQQKERDLIRKQLLQAGILDSNWNIELANGATFDIGKDGGARLINKDGSKRRYNEFDFSNPLTNIVARIVTPLAQSICGNNEKMTSDFSAYFTNAVTSNADTIEQVISNIEAVYSKFGIPKEKVLDLLSQV